MDILCDFQEWCRLCGSLDGVLETEANLRLIEETLRISTENLRVCHSCSSTLTAMNELITRAQGLVRMFNGLAEENESDLSMKRLNAYRAHFNLPAMELEFVQSDCEGVKTEELPLEYIEEELEEVVDEDLEQIVEEQQDEQMFLVDTESYMEEEVIEETFQEAAPPRQLKYIPKQVPPNEKTEEEKFFTFACHLCEHPEFLNMKTLSAHCKEEHNTIPQVNCCSEKCGAVLSTWRRLLIHKGQHFPSDDQLKCPQCQQQYMTQAKLDVHMEKHKFCYICNECGKSFKEAKSLRNHEEIHLRSLDERRNHVCPYDCGMRFISAQACKNHIAVKHQKVVTSQCDEPNCGKSFFTRKAYHEHVKNTHVERKFNCEMCNFKAKTKSALSVHRDSHKSGDNFVCDLCNASFAAHRRLRVHMICHSNVSIPCPHCDALFKRQKDLKAHIPIHTKERPFSCQFCEKSFTNAANARKHKLRDHASELAAWEAENGVGGRKRLKCYE